MKKFNENTESFEEQIISNNLDALNIEVRKKVTITLDSKQQGQLDICAKHWTDYSLEVVSNRLSVDIRIIKK